MAGFFRIGYHKLPIPFRASHCAAGYDLSAQFDNDIWPGEQLLIATGFGVVLPTGSVGLIRDRSSMARRGLTTRAGVIDQDYRGEIKIVLANEGREPHRIQGGERIAQLLIMPCYMLDLGEITDPDVTERGSNGFGSTN